MYYGKLWISANHTGKMEGMVSCSTCRNCNKRCERNASIKGSVCEKCYAKRQLAMYHDLRTHLEENFKILTTELVDFDSLPKLNHAFFRIESFGDIANVLHAENYLNLIYHNPHIHFGWWTKNCDLLAKAIQKCGKPDNVQILRSSLYLNKEVKPYYDFVDKTFTVYDKKFIKENNIEINCGGRKCIDCLRCYLPGGDKVIREVKK